MINSETTRLDKFTAPYGREITLENVAYENGVSVLRVHIREGNRHTVMDMMTVPPQTGVPPCSSGPTKSRRDK